MEIFIVYLVSANIIAQTNLFKSKKKAEEFFTSSILSNGAEEDDINDHLDDGYFECQDGDTFCIGSETLNEDE